MQPDMWGVTPSAMWDWASLRARVAVHGARNSLLLAPMPTASTAQILGNNESIEPFTSNIYTRRVLAGEVRRPRRGGWEYGCGLRLRTSTPPPPTLPISRAVPDGQPSPVEGPDRPRAVGPEHAPADHREPRQRAGHREHPGGLARAVQVRLAARGATAGTPLAASSPRDTSPRVRPPHDDTSRTPLAPARTVWEIKQRQLIDMAADRGAYICQSQSLNLFIAGAWAGGGLFLAPLAACLCAQLHKNAAQTCPSPPPPAFQSRPSPS